MDLVVCLTASRLCIAANDAILELGITLGHSICRARERHAIQAIISRRINLISQRMQCRFASVTHSDADTRGFNGRPVLLPTVGIFFGSAV